MRFKKITIYIVMAVLCLNFALKAQDNKAVDVTLKGIQIGQKVPEVTITGLHNYKDANGRSANSAKLSDFKGKLFILDFWATWCSPCVAMIPRMDSLQKEFGDKIVFLSVTYQKEAVVMPFLSKLSKRSPLPIVTGDMMLRKLFPHVYLPHYVWIDGDGVVRAITDYHEVISDKINAFLQKDFSKLKVKKDKVVPYNMNKPFLVDGNGGDGSSFLGHSILTGYKRGIGGGYYLNFTDSINQITLKNLSVSQLFAYAFGENKLFFPPNRILTKVRFLDGVVPPEGLTKVTYGDWANSNAFCYELIQPKRLRKTFFSRIQQELTSYFGAYSVSVSNIETKCLALVRIDETINISTKGGRHAIKYGPYGCELINTPLGDLIRKLAMQYMERSTIPIVDDTRFSGKVDLVLDAKMTSVDELNMALKKYGLALVEKLVVIPMLVITDRNEEDVLQNNKLGDGKI